MRFVEKPHPDENSRLINLYYRQKLARSEPARPRSSAQKQRTESTRQNYSIQQASVDPRESRRDLRAELRRIGADGCEITLTKGFSQGAPPHTPPPGQSIEVPRNAGEFGSSWMFLLFFSSAEWTHSEPWRRLDTNRRLVQNSNFSFSSLFLFSFLFLKREC